MIALLDKHDFETHRDLEEGLVVGERQTGAGAPS
jgi:hypothetical protein